MLLHIKKHYLIPGFKLSILRLQNAIYFSITAKKNLILLFSRSKLGAKQKKTNVNSIYIVGSCLLSASTSNLGFYSNNGL